MTPNAATKTYGDADPALTGTLAGFLPADGVTATYSRTAGETVAGSPYTISAVLAPTGVLGNYHITYNTAAFTITRRTLNVTGTAGGAKTYDATTGVGPGFALLDNRVSGDALTFTYTAAFVSPNAASPQTINVTGIAISGGTHAGNYQLGNTTISGSANILVKSVTGSFTAANKIFDGTTAATITGRTLSGVVGGTDVTLSGGTATFSDANVGQNKTVTGTGFTLAGAQKDNYALAATTLTTTASIAYDWSGFLQPINDTAHQTGVAQSKFKLGQTIPAKFDIRDAAGAAVQQTPNPTFLRLGTWAAAPRRPRWRRPSQSRRTWRRSTSGTAASTTTTGAPRA